MQGNLTSSTIAVGVLAILVGLVGAYAIRQGMMQGEETAAEEEPARPLLVPLAISDLPRGRVIQMGDVALSSMTREEVANRNMDLSQALMVPEQIIGRRLKEDVRGGKPFSAADLYLEGTGPNVTDLLKPGYRAATIQVAYERGGAVSPGSLVDVMFRSEARKATETMPAVPERSLSLIQGVEVLEVKEPSEREETEPTITLAVTPDDAQILQTVGGHGEITLVTRRFDELGGRREQNSLTLDELLGIQPPPQPVPPWVTEVYYRTKGGANMFPNTGPVRNADEAPPSQPPAGDEEGAAADGDAKQPPKDIPALTIPGLEP